MVGREWLGKNIGYHWRDGVYFRREEDGSVTVEKKGKSDGFELSIPPSEWASIVAFVGAEGGTAAGYAAALALHTRKPAE